MSGRGDFDTDTRFASAWYRQHGYGQGEFGVADNLARARNTSVEAVARAGILSSAASKVKLFAPSELPDEYDVQTDDRVGVCEVPRPAPAPRPTLRRHGRRHPAGSRLDWAHGWFDRLGVPAESTPA